MSFRSLARGPLLPNRKLADAWWSLLATHFLLVAISNMDPVQSPHDGGIKVLRVSYPS